MPDDINAQLRTGQLLQLRRKAKKFTIQSLQNSNVGIATFIAFLVSFGWGIASANSFTLLGFLVDAVVCMGSAVCCLLMLINIRFDSKEYIEEEKKVAESRLELPKSEK